MLDEAVAASDEVVGRVSDLGQLSQRTIRDGSPFSMRWVLAHMIEEYARHNGHADLIREWIDGEVGD
jgi:ribosomal protein S3AE